MRRSGPHLAPIWPQRRQKKIFSIWWGVNFHFTPHFSSQNAQKSMGNPNMYATYEFFSDPQPPPSSTPNLAAWLLGPDPPAGQFFFSKTPHIRVQNDQCDEVNMLGYVSGTAAPGSPKDTHPLPQGPKGFGGVGVGSEPKCPPCLSPCCQRSPSSTWSW